MRYAILGLVLTTACFEPLAPLPVESVEIITSYTVLKSLGDTARMVAEAKSGHGHKVRGKTFSWRSSDPSIASIDSTGLVTALRNGPVFITAEVDSVSAGATVIVEQQVTEISFTRYKSRLPIDQEYRFVAEARDARGNLATNARFDWSSSNATIATVNGSGLVAAHRPGLVGITALSGNASYGELVVVFDPADEP